MISILLVLLLSVICRLFILVLFNDNAETLYTLNLTTKSASIIYCKLSCASVTRAISSSNNTRCAPVESVFDSWCREWCSFIFCLSESVSDSIVSGKIWRSVWTRWSSRFAVSMKEYKKEMLRMKGLRQEQCLSKMWLWLMIRLL